MARSVKSEAKQRRQASSSGCLAADIEEGLLLAGKTRIREILGRGA